MAKRIARGPRVIAGNSGSDADAASGSSDVYGNAAADNSDNAGPGGDGSTVDLASVNSPAGNNGNGDTGRRGRGRPPGSGTGSKKKTTLVLGDVLTSTLLLGHAVMSSALKAPRLAIDDEEAAKLAGALDAVLAHYVSIGVDARTRDWLNLAMVAAGVYGPRIGAAMMEAKPREPAPRQQTPATELKPTVQATQTVDIFGVGKVEVPVQ